MSSVDAMPLGVQPQAPWLLHTPGCSHHLCHSGDCQRPGWDALCKYMAWGSPERAGLHVAQGSHGFQGADKISLLLQGEQHWEDLADFSGR